GARTRIAALHLQNGEGVGRYGYSEVVRRLLRDLQSAKPRIPIVECERRFQQQRVRRETVLGVASPREGRCRDTRAGDSVKGHGCRQLVYVVSRLRPFARSRIIQLTTRELQRQVCRRQPPDPARHGVERAEVDVLSVLIRLASVERRGL